MTDKTEPEESPVAEIFDVSDLVAQNEKSNRRYNRHAALVLAIKAEKTTMPLTEAADDLTDKLLDRASQFYSYLNEDD